MNYQEYIKERHGKGYTDADAIDNRSESTEELVKAIFADGYEYNSDIENAIIIRSGLDMEYDKWEEMGENVIFCALDKLRYGEDGSKKIDPAAQEIIDSGNYDAAVELMDDEIRESVHADLAPCSDAEFLTEYMARHLAKYGEVFCV